MGKLNEIKETLESNVYEEIQHNIDKVNVCELGAVIDMIKDLSEAMYYCKVTDAMEHSTTEEIKEKVAQYSTTPL